MERRDTKQVILQKALCLFSVRGYDGVSVKDIANSVGIKDSSLYKHYKSKQEIFAVLLEEMNKRFEQAMAFYKLPQGEVEQVYKQYGENSVEWLKKAVEAMFLFFLDDPYAKQFIHLLMIEQYKNNEAAKLFEEWMVDGALGFQTALFKRLVQEGYFRKADPQVMALEFYAPIFFLLLMYDSKPERQKEALRLIECHVEEFASNYHISHGENK